MNTPIKQNDVVESEALAIPENGKVVTFTLGERQFKIIADGKSTLSRLMWNAIMNAFSVPLEDIQQMDFKAPGANNYFELLGTTDPSKMNIQITDPQE